MKNFAAGVVTTLVVLLGGAYLFLKLGGFPATADSPPFPLEARVARLALGGYLHHHVPPEANPVPKTDANLHAGAKLYKEQCMGCHGGYDKAPNPFAKAMNPDIPQFAGDPPADLPESRCFFIAKHGIRMTGMPAFGAATAPMLKDDELWTLALFLKNWKELPPDVQAFMRKKGGPH